MQRPSLPGDALPADDAVRRESASASAGPDPRAPDPVAAEIQAEINDHLATAAERHRSAGLGEAESREKAREAFGDVREIGRRCYWIKQGDSLMYRGAIALLLAILALSLIAVTLRSWQAESRMADQIGALTAQLKELAERQPAAPAPIAIPAPIEITGRAFAGDRLAGGAPLSVFDVSHGKTVRQLKSDSDGSFTSGPLAGGDFALVGPVLPAAPTEEPMQVQFAPIAAYPGVNVAHQDIDLAFHFGRLGISLSRPLPEFEVEGKGKYESRIFIKVLTPRLRPQRWTASAPMPPEWPIYISGGPRSHVPGSTSIELRTGAPLETPDYVPADGLWFYEILDNKDIAKDLAGTLFTGDEGRLPTRECLVVAAVMMQVPRPAAEPEQGPKSGRGNRSSVFRDRYGSFGPYSLRESSRPAIASDEYEWTRHLWYELLNRLREGNRAPSRIGEAAYREIEAFDPAVAVKVPITAECKTRIRLELPDNLESRVRNSFVGETDLEKAKEAWSDGSPYHRHVQITVVGSEPFTAAASD